MHSNSIGFVMSELAHIPNKADFHLATVGSRKGRTVPLAHHIFSENFGWIDQRLARCLGPSSCATCAPRWTRST